MPSPSSALPALQLGIAAQYQAIARQFAAHHHTEIKRQQVYLNTLAVAVVNGYLVDLAIATDLEQSPAWQLTARSFGDVAQLCLPDWGLLACRPVLHDQAHCDLPPGEQRGCIAVQFDRHFRYATLVGFRPTIATEQAQALAIPLQAFQDFDTLLEQLPEMRPLQALAQAAEPSLEPALASTADVMANRSQLNRLSDWLDGILPEFWQCLDALFTPQAPPLIAVRSRTSGVKWGKRLTLDPAAPDPITLVVGVRPTLTTELDVAVELWPMNQQYRLPDNLQLQLLDGASGTAIMQAQARGSDRLQFTFSGEPGDEFDVKVTLRDTTLIEPFVI
ncbi:MAG: DUF1822 family protein [Cyanobacteria bacterium P01_G01_bin.54]